MIKFNQESSENHYQFKQVLINSMKIFTYRRRLFLKCSLIFLVQFSFESASAYFPHSPPDEFIYTDSNYFQPGYEESLPQYESFQQSTQVADQYDFIDEYGSESFENIPTTSNYDHPSSDRNAPAQAKQIKETDASTSSHEITWNPSFGNQFKANDPGTPTSYSYTSDRHPKSTKDSNTNPNELPSAQTKQESKQSTTEPTDTLLLNKDTAQLDISRLAKKQPSDPTLPDTSPQSVETDSGSAVPPLLNSEKVDANKIISNDEPSPLFSVPINPAQTADGIGPINFSNVSMIEYIRFISKVTNKNFVFEEEDLQFNVTIVSEKPTSVFNLMTALLQELRIRDLSLIEQGNSIIIHRNPRIRAPGSIVTAQSSASPRDTQIVTRVFRLNTLDPLKVTEIIKPLLSDDALVDVLRDSNNLIITDLLANVDKIAQLIDSLDAPNSGITVGQYVVRNGFADSLVELASKIILPIAQGNPFVLVPHASLNSIYIVSNPFIVDKALAILQNLDSNDGKTKVFSLDKLQHSGSSSAPAIDANTGKFYPQVYDPNTGKYSPLYDDPNTGSPPLQSYDSLTNKYYPQAYDPNTDKYYPQFYDLTTNSFYPLIYDPTANKLIPHSYDPERGTYRPLIYDASLGKYFPPSNNVGSNEPKGIFRQLQSYDPNTGKYSPQNYNTRTGGFSPEAGSISDSSEARPIERIPTKPEEFFPGSIGLGPSVLNEMSEFLPGGISAASRIAKDLPVGHIARTVFFIYKLKYRRGDQIETSIRKIALSLMTTGLSNIDLVSAINSVQWIESSNSLIFTGTVHALEKIKDLILEIDIPLNQVYIEMLILDTTLEDSLTYGVDWGILFGGGNTAGGESFIPGSGSNVLDTLKANVGSIPNAKPLLSGEGFNLGIIGKHLTHHGAHFSTISALVKALHTSDKAHIVLNPRILTEDNVTAEIFVGETDRYKTQSISNDQGRVITNNFQFIDVGTTLRVTPLIGNNGIITLDIIEEVTSPAPTANTTPDLSSRTDVNLVPVLFKNRSTTRIHIPNGFFVVMSGLIDTRDSIFKNEIPCLGMIPILGGGAKFKRKNDRKRNLMIFIRPVIVNTECEIEEITKRQQDVYRDKGRSLRAWNYEIDEALDFFNIKPNDPDEVDCQLK